MAGLFSKGLGAVAKVFVEKWLPLLKLLLQYEVFLPILGAGGIAAGVYYDKVSRDVGAVLFALVIIVALIARAFGKQKTNGGTQ